MTSSNSNSNPNPNPTLVTEDGDESSLQQQQLDEKKARLRERRIRQKERRRERKLNRILSMKNQTLSLDEDPNAQKSIGENHETTQNGSMTTMELDTNLSGSFPTVVSTQFQTGTTMPPSACTQDVGVRDGISPSASKRKSDCTLDASKKAKVAFSTTSEVNGLEPISANSPASVDHAHLWNPEFFIGGNPRMGPLKVDHSALSDEAAAAGLIYGARLPKDIAHFSECKDAWEIYTHIAKCLAGAIGATTELHNRAARHPCTILETDKSHFYIRRLEEELACKSKMLEEASQVISQKNKKIANQARYLEGLMLNQKQMKTKLAEQNEHCKMIEQQYDQECQKHKALSDAYNQLQHEKEQGNPDIEEVSHIDKQCVKNLACGTSEEKEQENPQIEIQHIDKECVKSLACATSGQNDPSTQ